VADGSRVFCGACSVSVERCDSSHGFVAFGHYGGALATAIRHFKYEDNPHLARPLGALLRRVCLREGVSADVVVPVPLHPRRLVERGYNQSALLASHVASELRVPIAARALSRIIDTAPQAELSREARSSNVAEAFHTERPAFVSGCAVALVDDVSTTGATLAACRNALLGAGATRVTSVVLAHTASDYAIGISSGVSFASRK
jgi:ComF family protein